MTTLVCANGHASTEPDYCSVCGAPVSAGGAGASTSASSPSANVCPVCGEPRADMDARFCEVCRYDFVTKAPGKLVTPKPAPSPIAASAPSVAKSWELLVAIDPSLDLEPDPAQPCPRDRPPRTFTVDRGELLVGRFDAKRDIHPEIPLDDPGASRRHLKIVREADGALLLHDLASTNGSKLNGADVESGARKALKDGDAITLGRWTRITVKGKA